MVFYYISNILKTGLMLILLNDYIKRQHKEMYEHICMNFFVSMIRFYSRGHLLFNNIYNKIEMECKPILSYIRLFYHPKDIEFVLDGRIIHKTYKKNILGIFLENDIPREFDFIIYSQYKEETKCVYKKIYKTFPIIEDRFECELSDISFILVECNIGDKSYKIDLKNETYNYYMVGNVFDYNFFLFELAKQHPHVLETEITNFFITIIDHEVKSVELDFIQELVLSQDSYTFVDS